MARSERKAADPEFDALNSGGSVPKLVAHFTRADMVEVKPIDWLVDGYIPADALVGLTGPSGCGKTFDAIGLSCCVATGTPWYGNAVKKGAVFIIAGEGRNGLRKRIEGWSVHHGIPIDKAPLYLAASMPPMTDPLNTAAVIAEIDGMAEQLFFEAGVEPALIVLDTVARAMAGKNENSAQDMGELIESMDWLRQRWGATVLAVHHTGHDVQGRARGSSSFYAALDAEFMVKADKLGNVLLTPSKAKDWEPPQRLNRKREKVEITLPGADHATSTLVLVAQAMPPESPDPVARVAALRAQGMTVREIAEETGIPRSTVSRLMKTGTKPEPQNFGGEFGDEPDF